MAVAQDKRASELTAPVSIADTDVFAGYRPGTGGEPNLDIRASAGLIRAPILAGLAAGDVIVAAGGVVTTAGRTVENKLGDITSVLDAASYAGINAAVTLTDVQSTSGSAVLTSPSGGFASAVAGQLIEIDGIGAVATKYTASVLRTATMGAPVGTTILAKLSDTMVTISVNATTTASGCRCIYGTDAYPAFAAAAAAQSRLLVPPGTYILATGSTLILQNITIDAHKAVIVSGEIDVGSNVKITGGSWYDRAGANASGLFTFGNVSRWTAGTISRIQFDGMYISHQKVEMGINIHNANKVRIVNCTQYERNSAIDPDGGAVIGMGGGADIKVLGCSFTTFREGDDAIGASCLRGVLRDVEIAGNYCEGFVGIWCCNTHNYNYSVRNVSVHDNKLKNCEMIARLKPGAFDDISPGGGILYNTNIHDNQIDADDTCWRMSAMLELQVRKDTSQASGIDGLKFHNNTASGRWATGGTVYKITLDGVTTDPAGAYLRNADIHDNKVLNASKWAAPDTWLSITTGSTGPLAGAEMKGVVFRNERCQYLLGPILDLRVPDTGPAAELVIDGFSCDQAMFATATTYAMLLQNAVIVRLSGTWSVTIPDHKRFLSLADTSKARTDRKIRATLADIATGSAGVVYTQPVYSLPLACTAILTDARIFADTITQDDTNYNRYRLIMRNGKARTIAEFGAANAPVQPDDNSILTIGNATTRSWDFRASGATGDESNKGATVAATCKALVDGLNASASASLTPATYYQLAGRTEGSVTFGAAPSDGDTVTVNGLAFTFRTTPTVDRDVKIGTNGAGTPTAVASAILLTEALRVRTDTELAGFLFAREGTTVRVIWCSDDWATGETKTLAASVATVSAIRVQYSALLVEYDTAGTGGEAFTVSPGTTTNMTCLTGGTGPGLRLFVGDLINTRATDGGASANGAPTAITPAGANWNMCGATQGSSVGALARTRARSLGCILAVEAARVGTGAAMTNGYVEFDVLEIKQAA